MLDHERALDADEIINEISEILQKADGEFIEKIANMVLSQKVEYIGDSLFFKQEE